MDKQLIKFNDEIKKKFNSVQLSLIKTSFDDDFDDKIPTLSYTVNPRNHKFIKTVKKMAQDKGMKLVSKADKKRNPKTGELDVLLLIRSDDVKEEVIPNVAGGGNIAGFDEPPGNTKKKKDDHFAGCRVFEVDSDTYAKCMQGKKPYARWKKYVKLEDNTTLECSDDDCDCVGKQIRDYAYKNPKKGIIVKDSKTGMMAVLKGKKSLVE